MNNKKTWIRLAGLTMALCLVITGIPAPAEASPEVQGANLVQNPGFEGGTYVDDSAGVRRVPNSWEDFNKSDATMHYESEMHPTHVHSGTYSARYYSAWQNHDAGLRQKITGLTPGVTYRLSGYAFLWATGSPAVDTPSTSTMTAYIGADPTGGKDPASANVRWASAGTMDRFNFLTVDVTPTTSEMWIFLRTTTQWPVARNDAFWDDITLTTTAPAPPPAPPAGAVTARANTYLRIRQTPSTASAILGTIPTNVTVPVLGRNATSDWVFIQYGATQGWSAAWLMTINGNLASVPVVTTSGSGGSSPSPTPVPPTTPGTGALTAMPIYTINFRSGPGTTYSIIGSVPGGAVVTVTGRSADAQWAQVTYNGTSGWLAAWLLTVNGNLSGAPVVTPASAPSPTPVPSTPSTPSGLTASPFSTINFRAGPGTNYGIIGSVPGGTVVPVIGRTSDAQWAQVTYNGATGWLAAWLLAINGNLNSAPVVGTTPAAQPTPVPSTPPPTGGVTATPNSNINFRSGPGTNFSIIGSVPGGAMVTVIARNGDNSWIKVNYNGTIGWLAAWLVTVNGNLNSLPIEASTPTVPTPPPATPTTGFALGGQTQTFAHPDLMRSAGMTWVKFQDKWSPGDDPAGMAGDINRAHAQGFKVLVSVTGQLYPGSINYASYVQYVKGIAALGADAIEIWNEMNLDREWPAGQISPSTYVNSMLKPAYQAIKAANPGTMVISGALAPTGVHNITTVWSDDIYLAGMRDAGAASYMDCVGVHHNAGATSPYASTGHPADPGPHHYSWYYSGTYNVYASTFTSKPLCFTEIGYLSPEGYGSAPPNFAWGNGTSVAEHAQWLGEAARLARTSGRVRLFIVFNVDFTHWSDDPQAGYAILRPGGSCPACSTLASSLY